jgi:hypothetical protein
MVNNRRKPSNPQKAPRYHGTKPSNPQRAPRNNGPRPSAPQGHRSSGQGACALWVPAIPFVVIFLLARAAWHRITR